MYVTTVMVLVKEDRIQDFIDASIKNHEGSVKESGNRRFDILHSIEDPSKFLLYEAYDSKESAAAHKDTGHYKTWRDTVAGCMAEPRKGIAYTSIRPV